jgi:hypothetical protein
MRVLVCGGRDYSDKSKLWLTLDSHFYRAPHDTMVVIQGGASGADKLAREWCVTREVPYDNYPANWGRDGKAAGPIRNARMLTEGHPDFIIAFPGGRGTADMVSKAKAAGIKVVEINP